MEVWTLMNKNNMTGDSLMWGWRYFIGNAIGNFINKNILSDSIELNQVMDDCINDIEESLKVSKSKFKFDKILLSKMNTNTKLIKNYVEELKKNIKDTWQDQYNLIFYMQLKYLIIWKKMKSVGKFILKIRKIKHILEII